MRSVVLLLCTLAADASFLSKAAAGSGQNALLIEALRSGGCGQPCERVLQSAVDAIANKSAGTVRLLVRLRCTSQCDADPSCALLCRMCGSMSSSSSVRRFSRSSACVPCVPALCTPRADLLQVTLLPRSWSTAARPLAVRFSAFSRGPVSVLRAVPCMCSGADLAAVAVHGEHRDASAVANTCDSVWRWPLSVCLCGRARVRCQVHARPRGDAASISECACLLPCMRCAFPGLLAFCLQVST